MKNTNKEPHRSQAAPTIKQTVGVLFLVCRLLLLVLLVLRREITSAELVLSTGNPINIITPFFINEREDKVTHIPSLGLRRCLFAG